MSPTNRSAFVSALLSHWLGEVASVKTQRWLFSEHGSWEPWSVTLPVAENLQCILMVTTLLIHKRNLFSGILALF